MIKYFASLVFLFVTAVSITQAATDTFTVGTQIFGDITPPSTPAMSSVTPVTDTQIDVVWGTATDNVQIGGYQLFRDGVAIATTTLTSFSDTGLTGSTTYSYSVRAFDISKNYSSTSGALATTTFETIIPTSTTPTPDEPLGPQSTKVSLTLKSFEVVTSLTDAKFTFSLNAFGRYSFRYGRTDSYELGYVTSNTYARNHQTVVSDLEPGTTYSYELIAYTAAGTAYVLKRDTFTTLPPPDLTPPANVADLTAVVEGVGVRLFWRNPTDLDFDHVRIVRSYLFFPTDPYDGFAVYEGDGLAFFDERAFANQPTQYYTVFSYDENGNTSSGAVVMVTQSGGMVSLASAPVDATGSDLSSTSRDLLDALTFDDILIAQEGKRIIPIRGQYDINGNAPLSVSIRYERLPEHLKTITVTLTHPDDEKRAFSFLLRINKDKTAYEATLAPLAESGRFGVTVSIFDFQTKVIKVLSSLFVSTYDAKAPLLPTTSNNTTFKSLGLMLYTFISLTLLWLLLLLLRRRRNEQETD